MTSGEGPTGGTLKSEAITLFEQAGDAAGPSFWQDVVPGLRRIVKGEMRGRGCLIDYDDSNLKAHQGTTATQNVGAGGSPPYSP